MWENRPNSTFVVLFIVLAVALGCYLYRSDIQSGQILAENFPAVAVWTGNQIPNTPVSGNEDRSFCHKIYTNDRRLCCYYCQ
jgi:carbon starvation protein CstA